MKAGMFVTVLVAALSVCMLTPPAPAKAEVMVVAMKPTLCLDIRQTDGHLLLWGCHGGFNQDFFGAVSNNKIYSNLNGRVHCLTGMAKGSDVVLAACVEPGNAAVYRAQAWTLQPNGELKNGTGLCMDVPNLDAYQGQRAAMWDCNGGKNQRFGKGIFKPPSALPAVAASALRGAAPGGVLTTTGRLLGNDASSLIGHDGSTLIGHDGSTLINQGAAGAVQITGGALR